MLELIPPLLAGGIVALLIALWLEYRQSRKLESLADSVRQRHRKHDCESCMETASNIEHTLTDMRGTLRESLRRKREGAEPNA